MLLQEQVKKALAQHQGGLAVRVWGGQ